MPYSGKCMPLGMLLTLLTDKNLLIGCGWACSACQNCAVLLAVAM